MPPMDDRDGPLDLPASMADIFLALVAVVILMLLSLLSAIQKPGGLTAPQAAEMHWKEVVIDGAKPAVYIASGADLQVVDDDTRIGLDDVLQSEALSNGLREAAENRRILLVIEPDGQESAFLFASLMGSLGVDQFHQLRVDSGCAYMRDAKIAGGCRR